MLRIAIAGASGRMGRMLIDAVCAAPDVTLSAALDRVGAPSIGTPATGDTFARSGVLIGDDVDTAVAASDVLIDFTRPEGTLGHLAACVAHGTRIVIGTTGFDDAGRAAIAAAAERVAVVFSPNMSVGVNVMFRLVAEASRALVEGYDVEIIEAHHRHKVDAPSGTAIHLGEIVAAARGRRLEDVVQHGREGHVGPRGAETIGFSAIRGGDIVGDNTVLYAGVGERIEVSHRAGSRAGYASGSVLAARFVATRDRGLYDMQDVLGWS